MRFADPLVPARLLRRYKRFLADVTLADGQTVTVHCPNPGAMLGLDRPGSEIWLMPATTPGRKLPFGWELIRVGDELVGINTARPNGLAEEAIRAGCIPTLAGYDRLRREVPYGRNSRIDLLLENDAGGPACHVPACHVEVKNVHMKRGTLAEFPDSVTARGTKHLDELARVRAAGGRAVMLYIVQRADCAAFTIARDIDPTYADALTRACKSGVEIICYSCRVTTLGIDVDRPMPVAFAPDGPAKGIDGA
ncbi:MAG: DNA/RNA nuclease SfsA [Alphaproteobacteria bacterium]|nr:DNA/RNA nuclease SfsA [Alphaproteobacteria bacterium]